MNPILEIFSQGEEIVTGFVTDTNAVWLSQHAVQLGFTVARHTALGDNLEDLVLLMQDIAARADCCLCTGGLGPTTDDLTTEAVAKAFNLPLELDKVALKQIEQYFLSRNKVMPQSNQKQAMLPKGAERIENRWGTAPGFALQQGRCLFVFMPGVPYEMKHMYADRVQAMLSSRFSFQPKHLVTLKTFGMGESAIQECMSTLEIPRQVQVGYLADLQEVQVKLQFPYDYGQADTTALVAKVAEQLGEIVFAIDGLGDLPGDLPSVVDKLMRAGPYTLAVQETASCGLLAGLCAGYGWLLSASFEQTLAETGQGIVGQNNAELLISSGQAIAFALQQKSGADFALVQFYAGDNALWHDSGQSVVLYTALLARKAFHQEMHTLAGSFKRKQNQAALLSLDLLRRYLQGKVLPSA